MTILGDALRTRLRELVQVSTGIPAESVQDDSSFADGLAVDSLSLATLQVNIESEFEILLSYDELCDAGEFGRIADAVEAKVRRARALA